MNAQSRDGGDVMSHDEIARRLGLTRSAVSKIEQRALRKLRHALEAMKCRAIDTMLVKEG